MNHTLTSTAPFAAPAASFSQQRRRVPHAVRSCLLAVALLAGTLTQAHAQNVAPASLANTLLHGTITAGTGGLPTSGTFSQLFTADTDYNIALNGGTPAAPASYVYTVLDENSATIVETGVTIALEFTSSTAGTFAATFSLTATQSGTFTLEALASPPLLNISTRTPLAAGATAIAGITIGGDEPRRVLVRVVGPGLAAFGVPTPMADPILTVYSGNTAVATNDNWDANTVNRDEVRAAEAATWAFALTSASADAATVLELEPGAYTVVGSSAVAGGSGEILIEVFLIN